MGITFSSSEPRSHFEASRARATKGSDRRAAFHRRRAIENAAVGNIQTHSSNQEPSSLDVEGAFDDTPKTEPTIVCADNSDEVRNNEQRQSLGARPKTYSRERSRPRHSRQKEKIKTVDKSAVRDLDTGKTGEAQIRRTTLKYVVKDTHQDQLKMESRINAILSEATARPEQVDFVRKQVNQALVAINEAKETYLVGLSKVFTEEKLEHWFGQCALLLHQIGDSYAAIRWFYTATMFPVNWDANEHQKVAAVLWENVVFSKSPLVLMSEYQNLSMLLIQLEKLAEQIMRREKWTVCVHMTTDLKKVHNVLSANLGPLLSLFTAKQDRLKKSYITIMKIAANSFLHLGDYFIVKRMAMLLLEEHSDYDDPGALELWALALIKTNEFDLAARKCELAFKYTKDEDNKTRLMELLADIKANIVVHEDTGVPNEEWLQGTQAYGANTQNATKTEDGKQKRKGKRRSYPKDRPHHSPSPRPTKPRIHDDETDAYSEIIYQRSTVNRNVNNATIQKLKETQKSQSRSRNSSMCSSVSAVTGTSGFTDISFSDFESDDDTSTTDMSYESRISTPESEPDTFTEETSFYAQSCNYHSNKGKLGLSIMDNENSDGKLLKTGLTLSFHFLQPFSRSVETVQRQAFYKPFKQEIELKEMMLKRPDIFKRCVIQIEGSHLSNGIPIDTKDKIKMIEISGRSKAGQVFNDDEVVVEVLDTEHDNKDKRYGQVVGILNRQRHKGVQHPVFICTLDDMESHLVRPLCKTVPKVNILNTKIMETCKKIKRYKVEIYNYDEQTGELCNPKLVDVNPGDRQKYVFLVAYISWTPLHIYPKGAVIKMLPCGTSINRGLTILNLQHEVPTLYRQKTVEHVQGMTLRYGDEPSDSELDGRKDLTGLVTFTIDPPGAKDLDDALSIETTNNGYKAGIHISDVSYYVRQGDPIDEEARERAVTFYPGIRKSRNMLPEPLSSDRCSLLPDKVRLTKSVFLYLDSRGKPTQMEGQNFEICESFIRSRKQLSYGEAQTIINDANSLHQLASSIKTMFKLAHAIRKDRLGNAMFAFDLENDEDISEDTLSETREAHYLVEEFMIMANRKVAQVLKRKFPNCVPLRCQPPPSKESMEYFVEKHGYYIDVLVRLQDKQISDFKKPNFETVLQESSDKKVLIVKRLWDIITQSSRQDAQDATKVIKTDDLHPLQHLVYQHWLSIQERASYRCSGSTLDSEDGKHYSLDYSPYTHFTSPIRRYNDLVIHRLLHALITGKRSPYDKADIDNICIHVNTMMKRSKDYQKGCRALQQAINFQEKPQMVNCYVDEVSDSGVNLCSPILKIVAKPHRELSFNLLDMSFKPEVITDTVTSQEKVKATWRKRLYDSKGMSTNPADRGNEHIINGQQGIVSIPLQQWAKILKCAIDGRLGDLKSAIKHSDALFPGHGTDDVSTECIDPQSIQPNTKFSMTFTHGQTVKVQMSAEAQKGILTPRPVLYSMTNNVKFCLQHADDPVLHLSQYVTRPTCDQYKTTKMYLERWLPLINMEAATGAVKNEESFIINNVQIKFNGDNEGKFALPLIYCEVRNIEFSGTVSEDDDDDNEGSGTSYDWLCIKCVIPTDRSPEQTSFVHDTVWVAHAEVNKVKKKKDKDQLGGGMVVITFSLHHRSPIVPVDIRANINRRFSVEVLTKSEVDRRTESYIRQLAGCGRTIAVSIALNDAPIPKLDKDHAHIAHLIERDLKIVPSDEIMFPLPANNKNQQEAIDKALGSRFSLIQGPPGTGKTYTGIKLIYLFNKINGMLAKEGKPKKQVLFCGPSNKSVDLVARWMLFRMGKLCPKIVRVYGRSIEAMEFPIPGRTFLSKRSTRNQNADKSLEPVALHHLIRNKDNRYAEDINAFDKIFKDSGYEPQPDNVKRYTHLVREASIEEIRKYDVIICTTAVGSNPKVLKATSVHQVIIDESGMCPESQCLVPIIATKAEQVVLIGDHKQLRPIIMCKEAAELGMETSLFERYAESNSARNVQFTMLDIQYRMNPALCCFPSYQFYDGKLRTRDGRWCDGEVLDIWPEDRKGVYPYVLVHVEGEEKFLTVSTEDGNERSRSNSAEIEQVIKVFRHLIDEGVPAESINIMSQYNAQCSEIKRELTTQGFSNFNVSTIVSSQGGEWDYIIFSLVRSLPQYKIEKSPTFGWCKQNLGFITDRNQINVALTRARKGLILIGNKNLLECDIVWKKLIKHYDDRGCIKTTAEFPPPPKTRQQKMQEAMYRTEIRYGDEKYVAGEATSYEGSFDDVNDGWETHGARRGRRFTNTRARQN